MQIALVLLASFLASDSHASGYKQLAKTVVTDPGVLQILSCASAKFGAGAAVTQASAAAAIDAADIQQITGKDWEILSEASKGNPGSLTAEMTLTGEMRRALAGAGPMNLACYRKRNGSTEDGLTLYKQAKEDLRKVDPKIFLPVLAPPVIYVNNNLPQKSKYPAHEGVHAVLNAHGVGGVTTDGFDVHHLVLALLSWNDHPGEAKRGVAVQGEPAYVNTPNPTGPVAMTAPEQTRRGFGLPISTEISTICAQLKSKTKDATGALSESDHYVAQCGIVPPQTANQDGKNIAGDETGDAPKLDTSVPGAPEAPSAQEALDDAAEAVGAPSVPGGD